MNTPTLGVDRVDAMRDAVMTTVDADVRHRGRRLRRAATAGVAAAFLVVIAGAGATLLQPGGGTESADSASSSDASAGRAVAPRDLESEANPPTQTERQVVTTGQATIVVDDPRREAARITGWVEQIGGRIDARDEEGTGSDAYAHLRVRVPADQLDASVDRLGDSGTVEQVSFTEEDVTGAVVDLDARIRALQISIDRLEGILSDAASSEQVVQAEGALTERQAELESLKSQRSTIGDQVALASLDIDLVQRAGADEVDPGGFRGGLTDGWNALIGFVNGAVQAAGVLAPWAAVALIGWAIVWGVRRLRR